MFSKKDAYLIQEYLTLTNGVNTDGSHVIAGTLFQEYRVTLYNDVQLKNTRAVEQPKNQKFILQSTQRISISNPTAGSLTLDDDLAYNNYPALLNTIMSIKQTNGSNVKIQLLDFSPKTINTAVNVSGSNGSSDGTTTGTSNSNTVGSSTAQTNSYGTSVSVGVMGDIPTGSTTASYEHSTTTTESESSTTGSESSNSSSNESSTGESMSIKDWGSYAFVNPNTKMPYWTFGQEVPWNAIKCRKTTGEDKVYSENPDQIEVTIPTSMKACLYDGFCLYPPSELSVFGVNFVTKATWLVTIENSASDDVVIDQSVNLYTASHILNDKNEVVVYRDKQPSNLGVLDGESLAVTISLNVMALDPLGNSKLAAIVGFIPSQFITKPANASSAETYPSLFKIISTTNELMIQDKTNYPVGSDSGFTASETCLTATFTEDCTSLQMILYFKVIDVVNDYTLYMKHWKTGSENLMLTFIINDDIDNPITKYVDSSEGEGGENNILSFTLRNQDFTSIEYHDYLQLGLNSIQISMQPVNVQNYAECGYQIRATSIETM